MEEEELGFDFDSMFGGGETTTQDFGDLGSNQPSILDEAFGGQTVKEDPIEDDGIRRDEEGEEYQLPEALEWFEDTWIGDVVQDLVLYGKQGLNQRRVAAESAELLTGAYDNEDVIEYIEAVGSMNEQEQTAEMNEFNKQIEENGGGFWGVIKATASNPTAAMGIMVSSLVSMTTPEAIGAAGTVYGAGLAAGSAGGPIGTGIAAILGAPAAVGTMSAITDATLTFSDYLQTEIRERGLEFNEKNVNALLNDKEVISGLRTAAAARGVAIGLIDGLTLKLGGTLAKTLRGAGIGKGVTALAGTTAEAVGGGVGEFAGQGAEIAAGTREEIDTTEIALESIAEIAGPGTALQVKNATQEVVKGEATGNEVETTEELPSDIESEINNAIEELDKEGTGSILEDLNEEALNDAPDAPKYTLGKNNAPVTKQEVSNWVENATDEQLASMGGNINVINDDKTAAWIGDKIQRAKVRMSLPDNVPSADRIVDLEVGLSKYKDNDSVVGKARTAEINRRIRNLAAGKPEMDGIITEATDTQPAKNNSVIPEGDTFAAVENPNPQVDASVEERGFGQGKKNENPNFIGELSAKDSKLSFDKTKGENYQTGLKKQINNITGAIKNLKLKGEEFFAINGGTSPTNLAMTKKIANAYGFEVSQHPLNPGEFLVHKPGKRTALRAALKYDGGLYGLKGAAQFFTDSVSKSGNAGVNPAKVRAWLAEEGNRVTGQRTGLIQDVNTLNNDDLNTLVSTLEEKYDNVRVFSIEGKRGKYIEFYNQSQVDASISETEERSPADSSYLSKAVKVLHKAFPDLNIVHDKQGWFDAVRDQREKGVEIGSNYKGFVTPDGKIYLNPSSVTKDTPFHEVAHVWARVLNTKNSTLYNKLWNLLKGTRYDEIVKSLYPGLTPEKHKEEVIANALGKRSSDLFVEKETQSAWNKLISEFTDWLKYKLNIASKSNFDNLTLDEALDIGAKSILTGDQVVFETMPSGTNPTTPRELVERMNTIFNSVVSDAASEKTHKLIYGAQEQSFEQGTLEQEVADIYSAWVSGQSTVGAQDLNTWNGNFGVREIQEKFGKDAFEKVVDPEVIKKLKDIDKKNGGIWVAKGFTEGRLKDESATLTQGSTSLNPKAAAAYAQREGKIAFIKVRFDENVVYVPSSSEAEVRLSPEATVVDEFIIDAKNIGKKGAQVSKAKPSQKLSESKPLMGDLTKFELLPTAQQEKMGLPENVNEGFSPEIIKVDIDNATYNISKRLGKGKPKGWKSDPNNVILIREEAKKVAARRLAKETANTTKKPVEAIAPALNNKTFKAVVSMFEKFIKRDANSISKSNGSIIREISTERLARSLGKMFQDFESGDVSVQQFYSAAGKRAYPRKPADMTKDEFKQAQLGVGSIMLEYMIENGYLDLNFHYGQYQAVRDQAKKNKQKIPADAGYVVEITNLDAVNELADAVAINPSTKPDFKEVYVGNQKPMKQDKFVGKDGLQIISRDNETNKITRESHPKVFQVKDKADNTDYVVNEEYVGYLEQIQAKGLLADGVGASLESKERMLKTSILNLKRLGKQAFRSAHNFVHNGRLMNTSTDVSHQSSKNVLAAYSFQQQDPQGEKGWEYTKVLTQDTYGYSGTGDTWTDRLNAAEKNTKKWMEVAADPMGNLDYIMKADVPMLFLRHILEMKAAIDSGDPTTFKSGLPAHMDATTSGIQFLAAATKDPNAARIANLTKTDERFDSYSNVVVEVLLNRLGELPANSSKILAEFNKRQAKISEMAAEASAIEDDNARAEAWEKFNEANEEFKAWKTENKDVAAQAFWFQKGVKEKFRKIFKGPVMTKYYSSKQGGMSDSLMADFKDKFPGLNKTFTSWLAGHITKAADSVFDGPGRFLGIAQEIAKDVVTADQVVTFENPVTGFKVVNDPRVEKPGTIQLKYKGNNAYIKERNKTGKIKSKIAYDSEEKNLNKQKSQIAPLIVHSLDAALVHYVYLNADFPVQTIHDSFATTPAHADKLYKLVREGFYEITKGDIFLDIFEQIYKNAGFADWKSLAKEKFDRTQVGGLDMSGVLTNQYAFSAGVTDPDVADKTIAKAKLKQQPALSLAENFEAQITDEAIGLEANKIETEAKPCK